MLANFSAIPPRTSEGKCWTGRCDLKMKSGTTKSSKMKSGTAQRMNPASPKGRECGRKTKEFEERHVGSGRAASR